MKKTEVKMSRKYQIVANALANAERFTLDNGTDELYIRKEDITRELLAIANGYKSRGGSIYIEQTHDLLGISFDLSERCTHYDFTAYAMTLRD